MAARVPFEPLDKACLAATQAPWASFAPTWRLEYRGELDEQRLGVALGRVLARYPWCACRVDGLHWVPGAPPAFTVLDLRGAADGAEREAALAQRFLDLQREPPLAVTWVRRSDNAGALVLQQHHALADGRAFFALLADFVTALDGPLPDGVMPRRKEREVLPERGVSRLAAFFRGAWSTLGELALGTLRPLSPLFSNVGTDYSGKDRTTHLFVPFARLEAWREGRKKLGLSANDVLAGALCVALGRWSRDHGVAPGRHNLLMPIDLRPRDGFESFANHLSSLQVRWRMTDRPVDLARALQQAAAPVLAARLPWLRVLFDGWMLRVTPLKVLRQSLLVQQRLLTNHSFSNLIPLGTARRWTARGVEFGRVLITTPCTPPQAANTTVVRCGDELCFNFNFKDSALIPAQVDALVAHFSRALNEVDVELGVNSPDGVASV